MVEMAQMAVPGGKGKATGAKEVWVGNPRENAHRAFNYTVKLFGKIANGGACFFVRQTEGEGARLREEGGVLKCLDCLVSVE